MKKNKTNLSVVNNAGIRVKPNILVGDSGSYSSGDILDANATEKMVTDKVNTVVGNANELLDTLEEIGGALPTKVSQLSNDSNFVSSNQLSTVATSGDYNNLSNKPTIPTVPTSVSAFINDAGYTTNVGTITGITMNGNSKGTSGVIDLGTVLTEHQSLTNYIQTSLTSGLVKNDGTIDTNTYLTQHQDISGKEDKISIEAPVDSTDPTDPITTLTCAVNKYYRIAVPVETLAVTLPTITDTTKLHTVVLYLTGGTDPNVTITSASNGVEVYYRTGFLIDTDKTYEVVCLWNGIAWIVSDVEIEIPAPL